MSPIPRNTYVQYNKLLYCCKQLTFTGLRKFYQDLRAAYNGRDNLLLEDGIPVKCPFYIFDKWLRDAQEHKDIIEANAMCLATATRTGVPSARFVLCKGYDKSGFKFFTHYTSRKGQELEENPNAALTFYWAPFSRSVRIEGHTEKLPLAEGDVYFNSRPYQSQIGALCSDQSKPISGRYVLSDKEKQLKETYSEGSVPRPERWGGYKVIPRSIEFWQGQTDRIHDRIKFRRPNPGENVDGELLRQGEDGWIYERLAP